MAVFKKFHNIGMPMNNLASILSRNLYVNQKIYTYKENVVQLNVDLPARPKRPMNPFIQYTTNCRSALLAANPNLSCTELITIMAKNWKTVSPVEKQKLKEVYDKKMIDYTKEVMMYEQSLTDEQKQQLKMLHQRRLLLNEKSKMKSKLVELGRPRKPATAFVLFMLSKLNIRPKDVQFSDWLHTIAKDWTNIAPDVKVKFQNESAKLMEQYKNDLEVWETKMIRMGHIEVVRRKVLLQIKGKDIPNQEILFEDATR